jgi:hypothetical protein
MFEELIEVSDSEGEKSSTEGCGQCQDKFIQGEDDDLTIRKF